MDERAVRQAAERYPEEILPPYDGFMGLDGFDAICEFSRTFSGTSVYVPRIRTIFGACLEREILSQYNGANLREMVRKYGYSDRHVRELIKRTR